MSRERFTIDPSWRELVESGAVKAVAVYDVDRLSRDDRELPVIVGSIRRAGCELFFAQFDCDTGNRLGRMMLQFKGFAAGLEHDAIRERTMRGKAKITNAGQWVGQGRCRYGYVWDKAARTRAACPERAPVVQRIFREIAAGMTPQEVADRLRAEGVPPPFMRPWCGPNVRQIIQAKVYKGVVVGRETMPTGKRRANGTPIMAPRPADERVALDDARTDVLVPPELWAAANARLASRICHYHKPGSRSADFLLAGMIWCGKCGARLTPVRVNRRDKAERWYQCSGNLQSRKVRTGCYSRLSAPRLEADAWKQAERLLFEPGLLERELAKLEPEKARKTIERDLKAAEAGRRKIDRQIKTTLDVQSETTGRIVLDAIRQKLAALDAEAESLDATIEKVKRVLAPHLDAERAIADFRDNLAALRRAARAGTLTVEDKRDILVGMGARVRGVAGGCTVEIDVHMKPDSSSCTTIDPLVPPLGTITVESTRTTI